MAKCSRKNAFIFSCLLPLSISPCVNKQNTTNVSLGMQTLIANKNSVFRAKKNDQGCWVICQMSPLESISMFFDNMLQTETIAKGYKTQLHLFLNSYQILIFLQGMMHDLTGKCVTPFERSCLKLPALNLSVLRIPIGNSFLVHNKLLWSSFKDID